MIVHFSKYLNIIASIENVLLLTYIYKEFQKDILASNNQGNLLEIRLLPLNQ